MIRAQSLDGSCLFENGRLWVRGIESEVFSIDWFERWTFARFLPGGQLALAFETAQPWSDYGSYGYRYGGVQVLTQTPLAQHWALVAIEYNERDCHQTFKPIDIVWNPTGLLAWLHREELFVQQLVTPRGPIREELIPPRDSDSPIRFSFSVIGPWTTLSVDANGRFLHAFDDEARDVFDLELCLQSHNGAAWEPLNVDT